MNKQGKNGIDYLHWTWSPVTGCLHGCDYCYMQRMARRFPQISMEPAFHPKRLKEPLRLKKPARIGVTFSGDLFGEWVPKEWIQQVLDVCGQAAWHKFIFLTKNPKRYGEFDIPENCWCGTSVTGSKEEQKRVIILSDILTTRRFISLEPWVGGIPVAITARVDWLIIGGKTGKGAAKPPLKNVDELLKSWRLLTEAPIFIKSNAGYLKRIQEYPPGLLLPEEKALVQP